MSAQTIKYFLFAVILLSIILIFADSIIYAIFGEYSVQWRDLSIGFKCNSTCGHETWTSRDLDNQDLIDFEKPCDIRAVISTLYDKQRPLTANDTALLHGCVVLLFFRNPRCATTAIYLLLNELSKNLQYQSILGNPMHKKKKKENWVEFVDKMNEESQLVAATVHLPAVDIISDASKPPVVFDIIRDPIEHTISLFKLKKYGDHEKLNHSQPVLSAGCNKTFDDYIEKHGLAGPCTADQATGLRYLCGKCKGCSREECVPRAKKNLETIYLAVGVSENIPALLTVMETLLPQFFHGALDIYINMSGLYQMFTPDTSRNETASPETLHKLNKLLAPDYEMYYYVRSRFYLALRKVLEYRANEHITNKTILYHQKPRTKS